MKADSVVILGAVTALFLLGMVAFMITESQTEQQLIPGGDSDNPLDYVDVQIEIRPFLKVGVSSFLFGLAILLVFALAVIVSRLRRA